MGWAGERLRCHLVEPSDSAYEGGRPDEATEVVADGFADAQNFNGVIAVATIGTELGLEHYACDAVAVSELESQVKGSEGPQH